MGVILMTDILDNIGNIAALITELSKDGSIANVADLISRLSKNGSITQIADLVSRLSKDASLHKYIEDLIKGSTTVDNKTNQTEDSNCGETTINFPPGNDVITDLTYLHPKIQKALTNIMQQMNINVIETFRTPERQHKLYTLGRTEKGQIVTNAQSFESYHNYGLALDVAPINNDIIQNFEANDFEWGGRWKTFKDIPHFQMTFGLSISQLKSLYDEGNLQAVWDHIGY